MTGERDFGGGKGLNYRAETLTAFKGRIDELLGELGKSPAAHKQIGEQAVTPEAYGTGFSAAEDLSAHYDRVHTRLKALSRLFGEQLEALGIATEIVDKGYGNVEADQRQRFQAIQTQVEEHLSASRRGDSESGKDSSSEGDRKALDADTDFD
ncbi:hypothetical protein [Streptomyces sp. CNQ085]|uniref:hypothetical protein n=1 Tax=Streptomyces sp. CNQ085 TaxID=2886944 RepID=UPI001F50F127|nr:hypothetical protein [Streptomyces sp. CNQ085]MCI0383663.1 hypothetical protein [Streptomyces sp. CNQ085]